MGYSLRVCRHCKNGVSLDAKTCRHCGKTLYDPRKFMFGIAFMAILLFISFAVLVYGYLEYRAAYDSAYCDQTFYTRALVPEETSCDAICEVSCMDRGADGGNGLLLSTVFMTDSLTIQRSCDCTCIGCFSPPSKS